MGVGIFSSRLAHGFPFFSSIIIIIIIIIIIFRKVRKLHCSHVIANMNKTTTHDDGLLATKPIFLSSNILALGHHQVMVRWWPKAEILDDKNRLCSQETIVVSRCFVYIIIIIIIIINIIIIIIIIIIIMKQIIM